MTYAFIADGERVKTSYQTLWDALSFATGCVLVDSVARYDLADSLCEWYKELLQEADENSFNVSERVRPICTATHELAHSLINHKIEVYVCDSRKVAHNQVSSTRIKEWARYIELYEDKIHAMKGEPMKEQDDIPEVKTTALAHRGLKLDTMDDMARFTKLVAASSFVPKEFKGKAGEIAVAIQYGAEIGFAPMQSLQTIAVINGKPAVYGDGLMALCLAHPDCVSISEKFNDNTMIASCSVIRRGHEPYMYSYGQTDAKVAKLWGKAGPWSLYPKRMLQMRARGFALRDKFADALKGIISAEEARDYPVTVAASVSPPDPYQATVREPSPVEEYQHPIAIPEDTEPQRTQDPTPIADAMPEPMQSGTPSRTGPVFRFGKTRDGADMKDTRFADGTVDQRNLEWYRDAIAKGVDDPRQEQYKEDGMLHLREIDNEILAREEHGRDAQHDHLSQDVGNDDYINDQDPF